ncbi:MAG: Hsp20/alpha crystallin family protein, partial [Clostridiales bacterium]|nr:Hsp20/alpha crystallin family protein [Clostridiales bacterium]
MLLPRIFNDRFDSIFDDFYNFNFPTFFKTPSHGWMATNIKDLGKDYQLEIELPGYEKKDIQVQLDNGYLTVIAERSSEMETKDTSKGRYIRKESYMGRCQRSFYVGEGLNEDDFRAAFDNGILRLTFPK